MDFGFDNHDLKSKRNVKTQSNKARTESEKKKKVSATHIVKAGLFSKYSVHRSSFCFLFTGYNSS